MFDKKIRISRNLRRSVIPGPPDLGGFAYYYYCSSLKLVGRIGGGRRGPLKIENPTVSGPSRKLSVSNFAGKTPAVRKGLPSSEGPSILRTHSITALFSPWEGLNHRVIRKSRRVLFRTLASLVLLGSPDRKHTVRGPSRTHPHGPWDITPSLTTYPPTNIEERRWSSGRCR